MNHMFSVVTELQLRSRCVVLSEVCAFYVAFYSHLKGMTQHSALSAPLSSQSV